jgi:XTP/dITP diphosphohydrolase
MMIIILATNNKHKVDEVKAILQNTAELKTLDELGFQDEIEESGKTFEENARIKARVIFSRYGLPCLSDDSGLEVEALNNEPGVYSARFSGLPVDHERNIDMLLEKLQGIQNRKAQFRTVLCYIDPGGKEFFFEGKVEGHIATERKGSSGFGYDPVFIPDGFDLTFAEMTAQEKNAISHRGRALAEFKNFMKK